MSTTAQIQEIYVGLLGRAADAEGLAYWKAEIDGGVLTIEQLRANIVNEQPEWQAGLGTLSREDLVKALYDSMFNRAPEAAGLEYWTTGGGSEVNADQLVLALSNGASSTDRSALDNKTEAATFYTENVDTYVPSQAASAVANVDSTQSSLTSAKGAVAVLAGGTNQALTSAADTVTGTDKVDVFTAALTTVNDGDSITGGGGSDILFMEINAAVTDKFTTSGVETVNVTTYGDQTLDSSSMSGVEKIVSLNSTGKLTVNKIATATLQAGMEGNSTNSVQFDHVAGVLAGSNDTLNLVLSGASDAVMVAGPGFENLAIDATGTNSITTLTVPGVTSFTMTGSGTLNAKNRITGATTVDASSMTGALSTGTADSSTGIVNQAITTSTNGATILLGSGNDNIGFDNTGATKSSTIKAGAGDDIIQINAAGAAVVVFAESGDDTISAVTSALTNTDVLDGGLGNDTVRLDGGVANNAMIMRSIENVVITTGAAKQTFTNDDSASAITYLAGDNAEIELANLTAGSTVTVDKASNFSGAVAALTVGFESTEASATIDVNAAIDGAMATSKIGAVTLDFAEAVSGAAAITTTDATALNVVAAKAFERAAIEASADKLTSVTITGADTVSTTTIGAADTNKLASVNISGAKAVETTTIGADSTKLSNVNLTSTTSTVKADAIGADTNAEVLNVTLTADGDIAGKGTAATSLVIDSTKLGDITATSADGTVSLGALGEHAEEIGDIDVDAKGTITTALIGAGTPVATSVGTIDLNSTDGAIVLANTDSIDVKDEDGLNVSLTAKTTIGNAAAAHGTTPAQISNTGGDVNVTLAGTANAYFNVTANDSGSANLTASNTGGYEGTLTNAGTAGDAASSTVILGNAKSGATNKVTVAGTIDTLNVTGGTGVDEVILSKANQLKTGTVALGTGEDILSFAGTGTVGVALNLGSTTVTFDDTGSTQVSAGQAVGYAADSASAKVVSGANAFALNVSGVSEVVGTAQADYIVANAEGTKITGGAGVDTIVLGAGVDTVVVKAAASSTATEVDELIDFTSGTGGDILQLSIADIESLSAVDDLASSGGASIAAGTTVVVETVVKGSAETLTAGDNVLAITGGTYADIDALVADLDAGGNTEITLSAAPTANDSLLALWSDGTDSYLSVLSVATATAAIEDGELAGANLVKFVGNAGITDAEFVAGNFEFIA
jgi:hypothetical protein